MNILKNSKIYQLQTDYMNGTGEHGPVHKKYAEILEQYRKIYEECPVYDAAGLMDLYRSGENFLEKAVITDAILLVMSFWGFKGRFIWFVIAFIAAFVKFIQIELEQPSEDSAYNNLVQYWENNPVSLSTFTEKVGRWFIWPIVVLVFIMITIPLAANIVWVWVVFCMPLAIDFYKCLNAWKIAPKKAYAENKEKILQMQQAETGLEEIRKQLRALFSDLQEEYREELNKAVSEFTRVEQKSVMHQYSALPEQFWWEINPSRLLEKEMFLKSTQESFLVSHEVAAIRRTFGNEYQKAGFNYAPMYTEQLTEKEMNQIYQQNIQMVKDSGGVILDFVDCIKYPQMVTESEVVKDYDFVENSFQRDFETDQWKELGEKLEEARSYGILTKGEYGCLKNRYDDLDPDVRGHINRKVEVGEHVETFHKYRIFARYEWTGQALLLPDTKNPEGYVLLDYRCRPEYEFDNLEQIEYSLPITQILADYAFGQQDFIAKMQRMIINSNITGGQGRVKQKNDTAQVFGIISLVLLLFLNIPLVPIAGIILGIISRKKGGGKLAVIGIILNIFTFIVQAFIFWVLMEFL